MANNVRHGKRYYKQMSLEVAVRNPERYEGILRTFAKFEGRVLDNEGILDVYSQLYLDDVVSAEALLNIPLTKEFLYDWIQDNCKHNNEWGYPTGYQAAFTRYLKTLSEFGFIYAQYRQPLKLSAVAKSLVNGEITLSEAFAVQSMRFWRKSPYRRVLNDFNFFEFIIDVLMALHENGKRLSYYQFMVALFSEDGNVDDFLNLIADNRIGSDPEKAYNLCVSKYSQIDEEHAKVPKLDTVFRDYGNTVFRVLQLTGFITIDYKGILLISPNENRMEFYYALKNKNFTITEVAKENEEEYFKQLGSFDSSFVEFVHSFRDAENISTNEYNAKIPNIIESYNLNKDSIEQALIKVSSGDEKGKDCFWFIQAPVKFEFLLTLFVYSYYGNKFIYKPNYICDELGIPYSHAPGNIGDIEVYNREKYWLIEATLIRAKTQQINNETVNLFRHIDESQKGNKYLTLVAPYIHDDTRMIFNVATIITLMQNNQSKLSSVPQTTEDFVSTVKQQDYFADTNRKTRLFVSELKNMLSQVVE